MIPGLAVGGICTQCWAKLVRRARRISQWVAVGTTLPLALYMTLSLPPDRTSRLVAVVAVLTWYMLTSLIARRVALEWMK
ncbi:MAG TPA: hypothetical protein VIW26_11705 [Gemmatimonadales bacterium]|jgi:hypothetical protein